ncbi:superkiller complex protein 2-like isoform X2 [Babylonia areolata]|uniref:superkiller complex protein 2-like isoform X2 n=1 Tax=Babylonia areolata TaxID=304850 RepID=UPI003FD0FEE1
MANTLNVRVASDLTQRQNQILREEREAGKKAYFWKGRLYYNKYNNNNRSPHRRNLHRDHRERPTHVRPGRHMTRNSTPDDLTQTTADERRDAANNSSPREIPPHYFPQNHETMEQNVTNGNPPSMFDMHAFPTLPGRKRLEDRHRDPPPASLAAPTGITTSWRGKPSYQQQVDTHHAADRHTDQTQRTVDDTDRNDFLSSNVVHLPPPPASPRPRRPPQPRTRKLIDQWGVRLVDEPENTSDTSTAAHFVSAAHDGCQTRTADNFGQPLRVVPSQSPGDHPSPNPGMPSTIPTSLNAVRDMANPNSTPLPRDGNGAVADCSSPSQLTPAMSPRSEDDSSQTFVKQPVEAQPVHADIENQSPVLSRANIHESGKAAEGQLDIGSTEQDCSLISETPRHRGCETRSRTRSRQAQVTDSFPRIGDKNVWLSVIEMLKKKDKLPMVAFVFSKRRIEDNIFNLQSVDLTTQAEKAEIHIFFHRCIQRLKGNDRQLPQVLHMENVLKRGLGVHHSGILPILKEVVEMLFQRGLVKILFATETFAMGVNMPARTVVFDSIKKHDGTSLRTLLPGEYIQMAGRAGRRGLDTTGTVIILCKGDVPETSELHKMMLGRPTQLESQFRLTDTMILNLLRVEQLRVEDMMRRSFSEFHAQRHQGSHRQAMDDLKGRIAQVKDIECYMCSEDLEPYYRACKEYQELKRTLQEVVLSHPAAIKSLSAGRVVVINNSHHSNVLAVVLQSSMGSNNMRTFTVLLICNKGHNSDAREATPATNDDMKVTPMKALSLFIPEGVCWHDLVEVTAAQISLITTTTIKVEADKIIKDVKKRQQPRFKDDPPSQSVTVATQELLRLSEKNPGGLKGLDPVKDLNLRDIDLVEQFRSLRFMEEGIGQFQCVHCAKFEEHFTQLSHNMGLKEEYRRLQFLLSDQSLQLLPEYHQRMEVLRALNYIDDHNAVQLKGRVACEISNHELMITELVFENVLTELHPTDIAAILSCMVFEQKHCSDPELSKTLEEGKQKVLSKAEQIGGLQKEAGMKVAVGDYKDMFHFGLMEVVFEWARGMPFSEITALTDVQEGIIVRCIQRLYELLRDVRNAARIIGEPVLFNKMEECMTLIKRDIVFAASLYTQ